MPDWITTLLTRIRLPGAGSRRLIAVTVAVLLLAWLRLAWTTTSLPEVPLSVLGLLLLVIGTAALDQPAK